MTDYSDLAAVFGNRSFKMTREESHTQRNTTTTAWNCMPLAALMKRAGGILTELLEDSATVLIPSSPAEIREALGGLKVMRLLKGYRGKPAADLDAVVDAVMAVQSFVTAEASRLEEMDINPLICAPDGVVAVEALVRWRGHGA